MKVYTPLDLSNQKINNLADPTSAQDAVSKNYADTWKRPKDAITIDIGGAYGADINASSYSCHAAAFNAAVTLANTKGIFKIIICGNSSTTYTWGGIPASVTGGVLTAGTLIRAAVPSYFIVEAMPGITQKMMDNPNTISGVSNTTANPIAFTNSDTTNGNTDITIVNFSIDGNGANQRTGLSSGGIFLNFSGVQNLKYVNVTAQNTIRYNSFVNTVTGASVSGTITATINSRDVTGVGTTFTSQLAVGQRIRLVDPGTSASELSLPIEAIIDDTHLTLTEPWMYPTCSSTTNNVVQGINWSTQNCYFGKSYEDDTFGGGGWDYAQFYKPRFENGAGYGFGTTASFGCVIYGIDSITCNNGIGLERSSRNVFIGGRTAYQIGHGVNEVNGCHANTFIAVHAYRNGQHGFYNSTTTTAVGQNMRTYYLDCRSYFNTKMGYAIYGVLKPFFSGSTAYNNNQGGTSTTPGFYFGGSNGYVTDGARVEECRGYDDQTVGTQTQDIYFDTTSQNCTVDFTGFTNVSGPTMPNYSASLTILPRRSGKTINVISGSSRKVNPYETTLYCNQNTFQWEMPRLQSIVTGHRVRYIFNGTGTPAWTFIRSTSDSFGTFDDYTIYPQTSSFWIEFEWDNTNKLWSIVEVYSGNAIKNAKSFATAMAIALG